MSARTDLIGEALVDGPKTLTELHEFISARGAGITRRGIRNSLRCMPEVRLIDKQGREPQYAYGDDDLSAHRVVSSEKPLIPVRPLPPIEWMLFTLGVGHEITEAVG